ncbi:HNH endonuclease [Clostridium formicaceticum]|uniref:HNH endonuclease n=1 Tax=Clostridium formicaceticum TaxID=1497 RepID=UPI0012EA8BC7|nr:hypothetical protein [Clostridium formicaceticum]
MNRCYAFNRDKGRCKICNEWLDAKNTTTHHINNSLPIEEINKVQNLASLCECCHVLVHKPNLDVSEIKRFNKKNIDKLNKYRDILLVN